MVLPIVEFRSWPAAVSVPKISFSTPTGTVVTFADPGASTSHPDGSPLRMPPRPAAG